MLELAEYGGDRIKLLDGPLEIFRGASMVFQSNRNILEKAHSGHEVTERESEWDGHLSAFRAKAPHFSINSLQRFRLGGGQSAHREDTDDARYSNGDEEEKDSLSNMVEKMCNEAEQSSRTPSLVKHKPQHRGGALPRRT